MSQSITCPKCETKLRTSTPIPAGREVQCPKCNLRFKAPPESSDELPPPPPLPKSSTGKSTKLAPQERSSDDAPDVPRKKRRVDREEDNEDHEDEDRIDRKRRSRDADEDERETEIKVSCSLCDRTFWVEGSLAGKNTRCPSCEAINQVPLENERPRAERSGKNPLRLMFWIGGSAITILAMVYVVLLIRNAVGPSVPATMLSAGDQLTIDGGTLTAHDTVCVVIVKGQHLPAKDWDEEPRMLWSNGDTTSYSRMITQYGSYEKPKKITLIFDAPTGDATPRRLIAGGKTTRCKMLDNSEFENEAR